MADMTDFVGPGLGFAGDVLSAFESQEIAEDNRTLQRENAANNESLQREFAQHGIQWRVEDAKAAGVHPVFALTGGGAAYSPTSIIGSSPTASYGQALSNMGQNLGRALSASETDFQRKERELRLQLLQSQIDESDARIFGIYSQSAIGRQGDTASAPFPGVPAASSGSVPGMISHKPDEVISSYPGDASRTAGDHPAFTKYTLSKYGLPFLLPQSNEGPGEALENVPWYLWPAMFAHSAREYGVGEYPTLQYARRMWKEFVLGQAPQYRTTDKRSHLHSPRLPWGAHPDYME